MTPDLIDWRLVGFGALWILGLSVLLATLGFADYAAHTGRIRLREALARPGYQAAIYAGLALFALGMCGAARSWWEAVAWAALALGAGYYTWKAWQAGKTGVRG